MTGKEIKKMRKSMLKYIEQETQKRGVLLDLAKDIQDKIDAEKSKWFEIQKICRHKFPNQKFRSYMGRGTCFNCGYNDY